MAILIDLPFGMCVRNFLMSGVARRLQYYHKVILLSEFARDEAFRKDFKQFDHLFSDRDAVKFAFGKDFVRRAAQRFYLTYRQRIIGRQLNIRSFNMQIELELRQHFSRYLVNELIYRGMLWDRACDLVRRIFMRMSVPTSMPFLKDEIKLVLFTHAFFESVPGLLSAATDKGIKTVGYVHSWDNLHTRGVLLFKYDRLLVWSEQMKEMALEMYPEYAPNEIVVTGSPVFNSYGQPGTLMSFDELCRIINHDRAKEKLVTLVLGSPTIYPYQDRVVREMIDWCRSSRLRPIKLIVRFEVNFLKHREFEEYRRRIEDIARGLAFVHLSYPTDADSSGSRFASWQSGNSLETLFLPSALKYSQVVVNTASTTSVQASIFDTPVISLFFNHDCGNRDFYNSFEIMAFHQTHYKEWIVKTQGTFLAKSYPDLFEKLEMCIQNPQFNAENRKKIVAAICGNVRQDSGSKIIESVLELCPPSKLSAKKITGGEVRTTAEQYGELH